MKSCCTEGTENFKSIDIVIPILKAVAETNRMRVLCVLAHEEICVCELGEKLGMAHNLISFHLKTLHDTGILDKRREGNQFFYFIRPEWKPRIKHFFKFIGIA